MHTDQALRPGTKLSGGKFIIDRLIGRGGFSFIYEGRIIYQLELDNELVGMQTEERAVIIKELYNKEYALRADDGTTILWNDAPRPECERLSEQIKSKTRSEALKLSSLRHPHILHIIGAIEENNTIYQITRKIEEAIDLSKRQGLGTPEARPLTLVQLHRYVGQLSEALRLVHSRGIIHLDIKPENILIDQADRAILIDFGISMTMEGQGDQKVSSIILKAASRPWAPVEQYHIVDRSSIGFETDIYALGQTIYALATGIVPPDYTSIISGTATLTKPSVYNKEISPYLDSVICRCIELKRVDRYQSMEDFERAFFGEEEYYALISKAQQAERQKRWADLVSLLNEAEAYIPLPSELQELRERSLSTMSHQELRQHLKEAKTLLERGQATEAKLKLALLPHSKEVQELLDKAERLLSEQRLKHLREEAELALEEGRYPEAEALIEQILALAPDDSFAQGLNFELQADKRLLEYLAPQLWDGISPEGELIRLYEKALEVFGKENKWRNTRLLSKLQCIKEYAEAVRVHMLRLIEGPIPSGFTTYNGILGHISDLEHERTICQGLYGELLHTEQVQSFMRRIYEREEVYKNLLLFFRDEGTSLLSDSPQELKQYIRKLEDALNWCQRHATNTYDRGASNDIRYTLTQMQKRLSEVEGQEKARTRTAFTAQLDTLISGKKYTEAKKCLQSEETKELLTDEERQAYLKKLPMSGCSKALLFTALAVIALITLLMLIPSEGSTGEGALADSTLWEVVEEEKPHVPSVDTIAQVAERLRRQQDSLAREQQEEVRKRNEEALRQEAIARQQEEERNRKAKREREEQAAREQAEANKREAHRLVQKADILFASREFEQACQLYCQANKLSPGSGSVGVQKFEELARQLAEDPSAPAYIKAKERAARIRKSL